MATPKGQRIGIWVIAIVMMIGTIGSFAVMILANDNTKIDQATLKKQQEQAAADYQKQIDDQQKAAAGLSDKYYPEFSQYKDSPAAFDPSTIKSDVIKTDLKVGDGATIDSKTNYQAYYIGWNPKGKSFDSSFDGTKLKAPIDTSTSGGLIVGWEQGVVGMKVGGIREISIPPELAYGEKGSGDDIPPNTPIKFIIMVIATK
jgi:FKBP-type peptidyl-prolyl cis-trans isomerase